MVRLFSLLIFSLILTSAAQAQITYKAEIPSSKLVIAGTSTLHDWESKVESYNAQAVIEAGVIKDVKLTAQVKSIKSGKSAMDDNTYKALKQSEFPVITFSSSKLTISGTTVTGTGQLTIAGKTKSVPVSMKFEQWSDASFQIKGDVNLSMTDFGIDPPTAMLGAIKTGNEITIKVDLSMQRSAK